MTGRAYKARKSPPSFDKCRQWPWSELPPTNPSDHPKAHMLWVTNRSNAPGITKSWLPTTTTRCDALHQRPQLHHVTTGSTKNPNPHPRNHFLGDSSSNVEAALEMPAASHWCLLKSAITARIDPPPALPSNPPGPTLQLTGVLGPNGPSSGLMVSYSVSRAAGHNVFRHNNISVWHECTTADPFDAKKKLMEFTSVVRFQGKFYATSLQGALAVMQVIDTRLKITAVGAFRSVPSVSGRFFKEYLFEMKGEILLVFLIHQKSLAVVDHVEVFRLDLDKLSWIKVERLRGKTVFLKERCIWVDSEEFGCRDDRVYFTEGSEKRWRVFDMNTCCISPVLFGWG